MPRLLRPDGCSLTYELHGSPDADALILLEGLGGDIAGWRRNIPHLTPTLRVIAYDFRGNGASDEPPAAGTMATFVDDTVAVLDAIGLERAHVYGQSFGGMVAQELALAHPDRVHALILACTHAGGSHVVASAHDPVPKAEPWRTLYAPGFPEAHPDHVADDLRVASRQPRHPVGGRRQWEAMQSFDAYPRLGAITAPTLVLHGTQDRLVAPANAEVLASSIPGAELHWLEGAGHLYHSEQAEAADDAVLEFLARRAP